MSNTQDHMQHINLEALLEANPELLEAIQEFMCCEDVTVTN